MKEKTIKRILDFFETPVKKPELLKAENNIDELYALCDDPMQYPIKLVNRQLKFTDLTSIQELFVENTGFLVVGVVGLQGCGKSTLLNVLANQLTCKTTPMNGPFKVQSIQNVTTNSPETGGIDLYITQDRIILLDTQPLLSFALTNYHTRTVSSLSGGPMDITPASANEGSVGSALSGPGNWSMDVWAEMASLQVIAFLLNCCHVVLVVSDDLSNTPTQLHQLIDRAAGLKPTVYTPAVLPQAVQRHPQARSKTVPTTSSTASAPPTGRQDHVSSAVDTPKDPLATGGPNTAAATVTAGYAASTSQTDDEEDEAEDGEDPDAEDSNNFAPERNRTARSGSDEPDMTVAPSGLLQPHRASSKIQHETAHSELESSDVAAALSRLQSLTDYSASLIHVYNMAPSAAFLDPMVRNRLHTYQHQLLPMLYPETRRLASMVTLGSRILSAHLAASRHRYRSVTKRLSTAAPANNPARVAEHNGVPTAFGDGRPNSLNITASAVDMAPPSTVAAPDSVSSTSPADLDASDRSPSEDGERVKEANRSDLSQPQLEASHSSQRNKLSDSAEKEISSTDVTGSELEHKAANIDEKTKCETQSNRTEADLRPISANLDSVKCNLTLNVATSQASLLCKANEHLTVPAHDVSQPITNTDRTPAYPSQSASTSTDPTSPHAPSEVELVAELQLVLREVENDLNEVVKKPLSASSVHKCMENLSFDLAQSSDSGDSDTETSSVTDQLDGERLNARLAHITHRIQSIRRQFFDVQQRFNHPRLFLVPEVDADGHPPTGCPSYASSVRLLQEAIMSTPRQHMMLQFTERKWIAYAQKMWEAVSDSPLFADYHAVLTNRL